METKRCCTRPVGGRAYKRLRVTTVDEHTATNMTVLLLRVFTALGQGNNKMLIYDKSSTHLQLNQSWMEPMPLALHLQQQRTLVMHWIIKFTNAVPTQWQQYVFSLYSSLLPFWQAQLGVQSTKHRHQSPEWTIMSHVTSFIQGEVIGFQVLMDSLHPHSTRASWWSHISSPTGKFLRSCWHLFRLAFMQHGRTGRNAVVVQ